MTDLQAAPLGTEEVVVSQVPWSGLELRGEDRVRFLQGLVTCDVKALAPGSGTYGFLTTGQGKVLADVIVLALPDCLWVEMPPGMVEEARSHLEKYLIADRVTLESRDNLAAVLVVGPAAPLAVERLLASAPLARWSHISLEWLGVQVLALRHGRLGAPAISLVASPEAATELMAALVSAGDPRARLVDLDVLERVRIEAGIARFGVDFGREHFPQETGAEAEAVSYTKGCYLGQEIVARIHYRGGVNRGLRGLRFEGNSPPPLGTQLLADGHPVGRVTSLAMRPYGAVGLSVLHKRGWEIGQRLDLENGGSVIVTQLQSHPSPLVESPVEG